MKLAKFHERSTPPQDRADYAAFLAEFKLPAEWVAQVSANPDDQVPMPPGWLVRIADSPIHGRGMFATERIAQHASLGPARVNGMRTPLGRYVNHSARPNAYGVRLSDSVHADIDMRALRDIAAGEEIVSDYRQAYLLNTSGPPADPRAVAAFQALPRREQIISLVADLMAHGTRASPPLKHTILNGMYMRELFIPAGMLLAGRVHKVPCLNICSSGDIEIVTEHGMLRAGAGFTAASQINTQKLGYAYADTVWINVFRTDLTDIDAIEREIFMGEAEMITYLDPAGKHFSEYLKLQEPA